MSSIASKEGTQFIECLNGRVVVHNAQNRKNLTRLSSTLPKALTISVAVLYAPTDAHSRSSLAQRSTRCWSNLIARR